MKRKVVLLVPMVENLPGGSATKPGDIVKAMNGMTIKVEVLKGTSNNRSN